ncbi:sugar phosphate isomerase/epimerase [Conexibacter sp. CPCC 206217]|uniref:sugar phosphate isomerase/epimerase family protein n=1 Tax=Conexibacter sp. CPCC 206217 TaxID=3064574 RepID=UPI00272274C8|nr:sugar phosphate isomerase/epimerase [Conexibacter sp. CPCC 206217]MDO8214053.1 sugar phosphate isomerase/epimerase [Conexibacter sp. CPCC 206217]
MSDVTIDRPRTPARLASPSGQRPLGGRLGLDVPRETWPTAPELKRLEACGYSWTQLHAPPVEMLADALTARRYADCLRAVLAPTGLRVVLHAPDALQLGSTLHDRAFAGLLDCAVAIGAEIVVYHPAPAGSAASAADSPAADLAGTADDPAWLAEEAALRRFAALAERTGMLLAVENLAPAYPVPSARREPGHAPLHVRDLVRRVDSPAVGMAFDLGHAHVTAQLDGLALVDVLASAIDEVVLFHVHDNLGAGRGADTPPGIPPLRLDLHMPPGRGTLPWRVLAPLLRAHTAPLLMEIAPGHRPEPLRLATVSAELLTRS